MTAFSDWLDAHAHNPSASMLEAETLVTALGWAMLWDRRAPMPVADDAVRIVSSLVSRLGDDNLFPSMTELVPELKAYPRVRLVVQPTPGLLGWCQPELDGLVVTLEEGLVRFVATIASFSFEVFLGRRENPDPGGFLSGGFDTSPDDREPLVRALRAYCGAIRVTGGNFMPLSPIHTDASASLTTFITAGALTCAVFHEVGHHLASVLSQYRPAASPLLQLILEPDGLEMYCDMTAAQLSFFALATLGAGEEFNSVALAGAIAMPRFLALLDDLRFVVRPKSHPTAENRREAIEETMARLAPEVVADAQQFLGAAGKAFRLHALVTEICRLDWFPRSTHHVANCLRPDGPAQFLLADDVAGVRDPSHADGSFIVCSMAITSAEEFMRRRTVGALHRYAEIGTALAGGHPLEPLPAPLVAEFRAFLSARVPSLDSNDPEASGVLAYAAAMIGQHYFWTEFVGQNVPRLLAHATQLHQDGVTHDDLARAFPGIEPVILLSAVQVMDRLGRGDEAIIPTDQDLAGRMLAAARRRSEPE